MDLCSSPVRHGLLDDIFPSDGCGEGTASWNRPRQAIGYTLRSHLPGMGKGATLWP